MKQLRVAIIGASGIGRHHANWWRLEGASLCAFVGRTPDSVAATAAKLQTLCGVAIPGFTDMPTMLAAARPDLVDVCSPPDCHAAHARAALAAGCDVLCEKPFVYDANQPPAQWLAEARALVAQADAAGRGLALSTQYTVAARLCHEAAGAPRLDTIEAVLRAPVRGRAADPRFTWIDLGPHLVGALQALLPDSQPDWDTLRLTAAGHDVTARFTQRSADGRAVSCRLEAGFNAGEPAHCRRLVLNGDACDLLGENGPDGLFRTRLVRRDESTLHPDTLRLLIRAQLAGQPPLPAPLALRNLEWTVAVWRQIGIG